MSTVSFIFTGIFCIIVLIILYVVLAKFHDGLGISWVSSLLLLGVFGLIIKSGEFDSNCFKALIRWVCWGSVIIFFDYLIKYLFRTYYKNKNHLNNQINTKDVEDLKLKREELTKLKEKELFEELKK